MAQDATHEVAPPADPRVRAFLDALAECVAESILRDLERESSSASDSPPARRSQNVA
jgi:hypothetical protein